MTKNTTFTDADLSNGSYDWNTTGNGADGTPSTGDSVTIDAFGYDNLASLTLTQATLDAGVDVVSGATPPLTADASTDNFNGTDSDLWSDSNNNNWTVGVPGNGASVQMNKGSGTSIDNLGSLNLNALTFDDEPGNSPPSVEVAGTSLTVQEVYGSAPQLYALVTPSGSPGNVTVESTSTTSPSGGSVTVDYGATGAGTVFTDNSSTDSGDFFANNGGKTIVSSTPVQSDVYDFLGTLGTIGFQGLNPGIISAKLNRVVSGDAIELPGNGTIASTTVTYGSNSLTITTSSGTFQFGNVDYESGTPPGWSASTDPTTGLEKVTLGSSDIFNGTDSYLWSDANNNNWTAGVPGNGASVEVNYGSGNSIDNVSSLNLNALTFDDEPGNSPPSVEVAGTSLTVQEVYGSAPQLYALVTPSGSPGNVTVESTSTTSPSGGSVTVDYGATGAGTVFTDNSSTDSGDFFANNGGKTIVSSTPVQSDVYDFLGTLGTIGFQGLNPGIISAKLNRVVSGDAIELPGNGTIASTTVTYGSNSLTITTSSGTFQFGNVDYESGTPPGWSASTDPTTGLEKVTLGSSDIFNGTDSYLWSDANNNNWTAGVPGNGASVEVNYGSGNSIDNVSSLNLNALTFDDEPGNSPPSVEVAGTLTVQEVYGRTPQLYAVVPPSGSPVNVTVESTNTTSPGGGLVSVDYGATGAGAVFTDNSPTDSGDFFANNGGKTIVSSTPVQSDVYDFLSTPGTIGFEGLNPGFISAKLNNVTQSDIIEVPGAPGSTKVSFDNSHQITITTGNGNGNGTAYHFTDVVYASGFVPTGYTVGYDSADNLISVDIACYRRGTRIMSERGDVPIETLRIGDRIVTRNGHLRPIKWIGRRSYAGILAIGNRDIQPVLIRSGALGEQLPRRDLYVSQLHAMYIDGMLIPAVALVNGVSVVQLEREESVEYFHLELADHDVLYAEGAASETFVDDNSRMMFHNACEYAGLYPHERSAPARFCAPRMEEGFELQIIRDRLNARVGLFGHRGQAADYNGQDAVRRIA